MSSNIWELNLPATPLDMDPDTMNYGLCELVRNKYLNRLREMVSKNLMALIDGCKVDSTIKEYIDVCVAKMEKEALRKCMVANMYLEAMSCMINDFTLCTENGSMHLAIKTVIIDANRELQTDIIPEPATTHSVPDALISPVAPVARIDNEIPAPSSTYDLCDESWIFSLAVENFEQTGIRQGSNAPVDVHPSTVRPYVVDAVFGDPASSHRVARTFEFQQKMKEFPHEVCTRVDGKLNEFYASGCAILAKADPLTSLLEIEKETIAYGRIVQLVSGRMLLYYEAGQINETMFLVLCNLISKNFTSHTYDPSEETVANTVDGFFSDNRCIGQFADISRRFIQS